MMLTPASRRLGQYELISYLGSGGMSDVYVALHTGLRKRVALKLLRPTLRFDSAARVRFLGEGECAARVRHPHVVDVSDVGVDDDVPYLVMELLEGETLAQKLSREGPLAVESAVDLLLPILDAVAAVHAAGVLHCDIKPANILLARLGDGSVRPKLVDFGIARRSDATQTSGQDALGTPHYMSPEQARGEAVDERSDQYAIGAVLFELLTGQEPFPGTSVDTVLAKVARGKHPRLARVAPWLPRDLDLALARATAQKPAQRFASVNDFAHALVPFASARTRKLWLSRAERAGMCSAQLLSGTFHTQPAGHARPATPIDAVPQRGAGWRPWARASLRMVGGVALLGLGLMAGLGVTRGEAEERTPPLDALEHEASASGRGAHRPNATHVIQLSPAYAKAELDGIEIGRGGFVLPEPDDALHQLRVSAPGHVVRIVLFRGALEESTIALDRR